MQGSASVDALQLAKMPQKCGSLLLGHGALLRQWTFMNMSAPSCSWGPTNWSWCPPPNWPWYPQLVLVPPQPALVPPTTGLNLIGAPTTGPGLVPTNWSWCPHNWCPPPGPALVSHNWPRLRQCPHNLPWCPHWSGLGA